MQVQVWLPEISSWLCPKNLKKLNSPRRYVLQMRERNPGVQREASAAVARPAPVTLRSCVHKDLGHPPKYLHSPTQELSGDEKKTEAHIPPKTTTEAEDISRGTKCSRNSRKTGHFQLEGITGRSREDAALNLCLKTPSGAGGTHPPENFSANPRTAL